MATPKGPSLVELATQILEASKIVQAHLDTLPEPGLSFSEDGLTRFPVGSDEVMEARVTILDSTLALRDLCTGPDEMIKDMTAIPLRSAAHLYVQHYDIIKHIPLNGSISYEDLASASRGGVDRISRIIPYLMLERFFTQPKPRHVGHSAATKAIATNSSLGAIYKLFSKIYYPTATKFIEACETFGDNPGPYDTPWNLAFNAHGMKMYEWWEKNDPVMIDLTRLSMMDSKYIPSRRERFLETGFDWAGLPEGSKVVDVGGNQGYISTHLAQKFPHLNFVVQDLQGPIERGKENLPVEFHDRVQLMVHSFFDEQPVKDADVFLFHWVLMEYKDETLARILKPLADVMKPTSKIVVRDAVMLEPGKASGEDERVLRRTDIISILHSDGRIRDLDGWKRDFNRAESRLRFEGAVRQKGSSLTVLTWGIDK